MILRDHRVTATPPVLQSVEDTLLSQLAGSFAVWTGRAATALYWAYRLARATGAETEVPEVIVPAVSCTTPAAAALLAGFKPRFADVDRATGMPTLADVQERWTPATRAVVAIHLYGQTGDLTGLASWCRANHLLLIEDVAQAQGAILPNGAPAGSMGDIAVYSFNRTKIIDCGGGAMVVRGDFLAPAWQAMGEEPLPPEWNGDVAAVMGTSYRDLYQGLVSLRRTNSVADVSRSFLSLHSAYSGLYIRSLQSPERLASAWANLPCILESRAARARLYSEILAGGPWTTLDGWRASGVCWRYLVLLDDPSRLVSFTEAMRRKGFYASNLYWPVNELLGPADACPAARDFASRIVNLWVDAETAPERVRACAEAAWSAIQVSDCS